MQLWKIWLIVAAILVPLCYILYYFGIGFTSSAGFAVFRASYSLPTRWTGKLMDSSGYMRRNFVVFQKYSALSIEVETDSGALDFEVKGPDGSTLSPASGAYGRDSSFVIDLSRVKRCSITLRTDHFCGAFHIALQ